MAIIKALLFGIFIMLFQSTFAAGETVIVQKEQNGQTITVKAGDFIQLELAERGSTGYSWHVFNLETPCLSLISEETRKASEERKIGMPVMRVWRFEAKKVCQTEIKMDYYRKWEGIGKSADHFFIRIKIIQNGR